MSDDGVIVSIDQIRLAHGPSGKRTGIIDVCRDGNGNVHIRANRLGQEVVLKLPPPLVRSLITALERALAVEDTCSICGAYKPAGQRCDH